MCDLNNRTIKTLTKCKSKGWPLIERNWQQEPPLQVNLIKNGRSIQKTPCALYQLLKTQLLVHFLGPLSMQIEIQDHRTTNSNGNQSWQTLYAIQNTSVCFRIICIYRYILNISRLSYNVFPKPEISQKFNAKK